MEDLSSYLGKLALYDYEFFCETSMLLLAETIVSIVMEIMHISVSEDFFDSSSILRELCKQRLLKIGKYFKQRFNSLNNLNKFTPKEVLTAVEALYLDI